MLVVVLRFGGRFFLTLVNKPEPETQQTQRNTLVFVKWFSGSRSSSITNGLQAEGTSALVELAKKGCNKPDSLQNLAIAR